MVDDNKAERAALALELRCHAASPNCDLVERDATPLVDKERHPSDFARLFGDDVHALIMHAIEPDQIVGDLCAPLECTIRKPPLGELILLHFERCDIYA